MFETFKSWEEVLAFIANGGHLYYHAPLDVHPVAVRVVKVFKNGKVRLDADKFDVDAFTADKGHLDRFRKKQ